MSETRSSEDAEETLRTFESNAQLWRLDIARFANGLSEQAAFGAAPDQALQTSALVALDGLESEIARFQAYATREAGRPLDALVRLAEVAVTLQTTRTRLCTALKLND